MKKILYLNIFCVLLILIFSVLAYSQITQLSVWHNNPVNNERINNRLAEYADKYESYAPIPRMALFDIGYPYNVDEFNQLDGNAVLMITALSQKETELPLKRVYVFAEGKEIELTSLKEVLSKISDTANKIGKVFGNYRVDALYLLPIYLRFSKADVMADFANYSTPLKIASFDGQIPKSISVLPNKQPTGKGYSKEFLDTFLKREYPAFFESEKTKDKN